MQQQAPLQCKSPFSHNPEATHLCSGEDSGRVKKGRESSIGAKKGARKPKIIGIKSKTHCFDRKLYNNCDYNFFEQIIEDGSIKNNSIYTFSTLLNKFNKHYKYLYTTIDSTVPNNIETIEIETITVLIESIVLRLNNENDHDIYDIMNRTLIPNIFSNCVIQNYEHFSGANIHCDLINNTLSIDDDYIQYMFDFEHKDKLDHFHSGVEIIIENNIYYEKITEIDDESDQDSN